MPDGLWTRCDGCKGMVYKKTVEERMYVCPECNYHFRVFSRDRLKLLIDENSFEETWGNMVPCDPLNFKDRITYPERVAAEKATELRLPLIIISGSGGGARMQEGVFSLMQMAKTSAAIARFREAGGLYISVLTDPSLGGVMASFASLADIMMAEPKALIGFAGPRVIQETIRRSLPKGFQTAEFLLEHGFLDMIVHRQDMKKELSRLIDYLQQSKNVNCEVQA